MRQGVGPEACPSLAPTGAGWRGLGPSWLLMSQIFLGWGWE